MCSLQVWGLVAAKLSDNLFYIVIFYGKLLPCAPNAYIIRAEPEMPCGFYFSVLA